MSKVIDYGKKPALIKQDRSRKSGFKGSANDGANSETEREVILLNIIQCMAGNQWFTTDRTEPVWTYTRNVVDKALEAMFISGSASNFSMEDLTATHDFLSCLFVSQIDGVTS